MLKRQNDFIILKKRVVSFKIKGNNLAGIATYYHYYYYYINTEKVKHIYLFCRTYF